MEIDTIITLDDNSVYALLDETIIDERKYFFAVKLDNKNNPTTEYEIFECIIENGETYMELVSDNEFKESILVDFTNNYIKMVENI